MSPEKRHRAQRPMSSRTHLEIKFWHKDWLKGNTFLPLLVDVIGAFLNSKFKKNAHWVPAYDLAASTKANNTLLPKQNFDAEIYVEVRLPVVKADGDIVADELKNAIGKQIRNAMKELEDLRLVRLTLKYICDGETSEIEKTYDRPRSVPKHYGKIMTPGGIVSGRPD